MICKLSLIATDARICAPRDTPLIVALDPIATEPIAILIWPTAFDMPCWFAAVFVKSICEDCTPKAFGATFWVVMLIVWPTSLPVWKDALKFWFRNVDPLYSVWETVLFNWAMSC